MNCRNAFQDIKELLQSFLNIENCMTIRASLSVLKKEIFTEKILRYLDVWLT